MKTQRVRIDPGSASLSKLGRIDPDRVDATTEEDIARQMAADKTGSSGKRVLVSKESWDV